MALEVRTVAHSELDGWAQQLERGFLMSSAEGRADFLAGVVDLPRTWAAFDGDGVVGTLRSFATPLTVPGPADVTAAALTNVTVAPTHRRRGLLTAMITSDLADSARRGEAVGILIASEYPIYGRFGYGPAIESASYQIDTTLASFRLPFASAGPASGGDAGDVELVDPPTLRRLAPPVYECYRSGQPGAIGRDGSWWDRTLQQVPVPGTDPWDGYQVVYRSAGGAVDGYARYHAHQHWEHMRPASTLTVSELVALTPAAYRELWRFCCGVDLVTTVTASDRSVIEALPWLLVDGRAVRQTSRHDFVWVRVLDAEAALAARRYRTPGRIVLEVVDPLGFADGRYVLDGGPDGATCTRSDEAPDVTMPVDMLGSIYLGGTTLSVLGAAGRVEEHAPGVIAHVDAMFCVADPPWCSTWF